MTESLHHPDRAGLSPHIRFAPTPEEMATREAANAWLFASAAADIRCGEAASHTLFDGLPPDWIIGGGDTLPPLYLAETRAPATHLHHFPTACAAIERGPRSPTGSAWRLPHVDSEPLLVHAARFGNADVVQTIFERFSDAASLHTKSADGYSLMHLAAWSASPRTVAVLMNENRRRAHDIDPIELMIDIDERGPDGETALHVAVVLEDAALFRTLLLHGADLNAPLIGADEHKLKFLTREALRTLAEGGTLKRNYASVRDLMLERALTLSLIPPNPHNVFRPMSSEESLRQEYSCCSLI
jgi:hypothetical protein